MLFNHLMCGTAGKHRGNGERQKGGICISHLNLGCVAAACAVRVRIGVSAEFHFPQGVMGTCLTKFDRTDKCFHVRAGKGEGKI